MQNQLNRRQALTGITLAGAIGMLPIAAAAVAQRDPDAAILQSWEARQAALARIEARGDYFDAEEHSATDAAIYDGADALITRATASTPKGMLAQAWVALSYVQDSFSATNQRQNALIRRAAYSELLKEGEHLDWELRTILAVIRSLRTVAGEA
jgi:cytochrome c556